MRAAAESILTIDLDALVDNYRTLSKRANTAAVVKANAYGLGVERIAPALNNAGCSIFFVATLDEGIQLRTLLPDAEIHVFDGVLPGWKDDLLNHHLIPVLNSPEQIDLWGNADAADLHVDTGMSRLGLMPSDWENLPETDLLISHLASADTPDHPQNAAQLKAFNLARDKIPHRRASLSASSGAFLGAEYHFDLVRAGVSLYGVNPEPGKPNKMAQVVRLQARILQVRLVDSPQSVGYGASYQVSQPTRIATVAIGYADGYLRSLGNEGIAYIEGHEVPVVGRVSMDLTTLDVTDVPADLAQPGCLVDMIGPGTPIDDVAAKAGTIGYEILTRLGPRPKRIYASAEDK